MSIKPTENQAYSVFTAPIRYAVNAVSKAIDATIYFFEFGVHEVPPGAFDYDETIHPETGQPINPKPEYIKRREKLIKDYLDGQIRANSRLHKRARVEGANRVWQRHYGNVNLPSDERKTQFS